MDVYLVAPEQFFQLEGDMDEGWGIFTDLNLAIEKCKEWARGYERDGNKLGNRIMNVEVFNSEILIYVDQDKLENPDMFPPIIAFDCIKKSLNEISEDTLDIDQLYTLYTNAVKNRNDLKVEIKAIKSRYSDPDYARKKRATKQLLRLKLKTATELVNSTKQVFRQKCKSISNHVKSKNYLKSLDSISDKKDSTKLFLVGSEDFWTSENLKTGWGIFSNLDTAVEACKRWAADYTYDDITFYAKSVKEVEISKDCITLHLDLSGLPDAETLPETLDFDYVETTLDSVKGCGDY